MSVRTCDHLKEDGVFCKSPALNGRNYCYFHLNLRGRRLKAARARRRGDNPSLNLPFPEDMHAVQVSLAEILWALAEHRIDHKAAGLMLYTLQQASTNLNQTPRWQGERKAVETGRPLRALSDPDFEKRFDVPENIDLDADPAVQENLGSPQLLSSADNRPLTTDNSPVGAPPLSPGFGERVGSSAPPPAEPSPVAAAPDRVPVPEDVLADLKMTQAEKMEFFLYCWRFDTLTPEKEDQLRVAWLQAKRLGQLPESPEDRQSRAGLEAMFPDTPRSSAQDVA